MTAISPPHRADAEAALRAALAAWPHGVRPLCSDAALRVLEQAEALATSHTAVAPELWHSFLELTRASDFLEGLPTPAARARWAEVAFAAIRASAYTLETMLAERVRAHPARVYLAEARPGARGWSYELVRERTRAIATTLLAIRPEPRVAIVAGNSVESACADLACLLHGIFVAPLDTHLDVETLAWICERIGVNVIITDAAASGAVEAARARLGRPLHLVHLAPEAQPSAPGDIVLAEALASQATEQVDRTLAAHPRFALDAPATAMFTSGSTGRPKGVLFTLENLVTKRFARGAALPAVGRDEVLLAYLPLFHTFGRYLELLGALYWGGTYVFLGNPSSETLLSQMREVRPTGLVSVPLRWAQIREHFVSRALAVQAEPANEARLLRSIVGDRLRWGISAAGHLDAKVFRFFNRLGVELCSGFGMTEATGGITMTPPGAYVDETVGLPLPGMRTRLSDEGELEIAGPYIARYLDEDVPAGEHWVKTGDIFRRHPDGFFEIVDRVKDVYKNAKGQTVAPRRVEQRFAGVPGIKRVFLAGDGREYNTLLVATDRDDPVLANLRSADEERDYFLHLIAAANADLAKHERVVGFSLLERDFSADLDELTPKGSYRRKVIEAHFANEIAELYRSRFVELRGGGLAVRVPRWLLRDLGVLEQDLALEPAALVNKRSGTRLTLARAPGGHVRVGCLEYHVPSGVIDLGLFVRQPLLWLANPELTAFYPCKEGWDLELGEVGRQVHLPTGDPGACVGAEPLRDARLDPKLAQAHAASVRALFARGDEAQNGIRELGELLTGTLPHAAGAVRQRLSAVARHPEEKARTLAYRLLLLDTPADHSEVLAAFIASGRSFLTEESIAAIASSNLERRRFEALRQRLHGYRAQLTFMGTPAEAVPAFVQIFTLLGDFVRFHPEYYAAIREELTTWALLEADEGLARTAAAKLAELTAWWHKDVLVPVVCRDKAAWEGKLGAQDGLSAEELERLGQVLLGTGFLEGSLMLTADGAVVRARDIGPSGIWVARLPSSRAHSAFRVSVNTSAGKHYDLRLMLRPDLGEPEVQRTTEWLIALAGYPYGQAVAPRVGLASAELGALAVEYVPEISVRGRLHELARDTAGATSPDSTWAWRRLFVRAMGAFFTAWRNSGKRIVPGSVDPGNVVVREPDYREGSIILSVLDWRAYASPLSLVGPLVRGFYEQTVAQYPWSRSRLDWRWLFEACREALGQTDAEVFLRALARDLEGGPASLRLTLTAPLTVFLADAGRSYQAPLALDCAVRRFDEWRRFNRHASAKARAQLSHELERLYGLDRHGTLCRYHLYRRTYFAQAEEPVRLAWDALLDTMRAHPDQPPTTMVEVSELQGAMAEPYEREVLARILFPHALPEQRLEVLAIGCAARQVVVRSHVRDHLGNKYDVREPVDAAEVGTLYRLFVTAGFPKPVSRRHCFLVAFDARGEMVGGVSYNAEDRTVVHLDGVVVTSALRGRGLSSALLEDFCVRVGALGIRVVRTFFFAPRFYTQHGFTLDEQWGGLVRFLADRPPSAA